RRTRRSFAFADYRGRHSAVHQRRSRKGFNMTVLVCKWLRPLVIVAFFVVPCSLIAGPQDVKDKKDKQAAKDKKDSKDSETTYGADVPQKELNKEFIDLCEIYLWAFKEAIKDRPRGDRDPRDNAFGALNLCYFAILPGALTVLPWSCVMLGGGIGAAIGFKVALVTSGTLAVVAIPLFTGVGLSIGAGVGGVSAFTIIFVASVLYLVLKDYIEEKYPKAEAGTAPRGGKVAARAAPRYAGPHESLGVHLINEVTTPRVITIGKKWDKAPDLNAKQQKILRQCGFLKKYFEKIAYIKQYKKMSPNALPPQPLSNFIGPLTQTLRAATQATETLWLKALGADSLGGKISGGKLILDTPRSLTAVGAPKEVTMNLPGFDVKVP